MKYIIVQNNQIVYQYEADQPQAFGGSWSAEYSQHLEIDPSIQFPKLVDGVVVEDEEKKQQYEAQIQSQEALNFLNTTDWKVIRHRDQQALGVPTSMTEEQFQELLEQRQSARDSIINT